MTIRLERRPLWRLLRTVASYQTRALRKVLTSFNRLHVHPDLPHLMIPFSVSTKFNPIFWTPSWKTYIIKQLYEHQEFFIDIGANIGQTLLDFYAHHPEGRYVGFEPNPACVFYLNELIAINHLKTFQIFPVALGDRTACLPFYRGETQMDSMATLENTMYKDRNTVSEFVPVFAFDDLVSAIGDERISLIKIDVEGAELKTLRGMQSTLQRWRPIVLREVLLPIAGSDVTAKTRRDEDLMQFLTASHYEVFRVRRDDGDRRVIGLERERRFPTEIWSPEKAALCDYLFLPAERVDATVRALVGAAAVARP